MLDDVLCLYGAETLLGLKGTKKLVMLEPTLLFGTLLHTGVPCPFDFSILLHSLILASLIADIQCLPIPGDGW